MKEEKIITVDREKLADLISRTKTAIGIYVFKGKIERVLKECGYELKKIYVKEDKKQYFDIVEIEDFKKELIITNKFGYIDFTDCYVTSNEIIHWNKSIGSIIKGKHREIEFEFKIMKYNGKKREISILFNNEEKIIKIGDLKKGIGLDTLLGFKVYGYKYEIGENIINNNTDITITDRKIIYDKNGIIKGRVYKYQCNKCGFDCGKHYIRGEEFEEYWITQKTLDDSKRCVCCGLPSPRITVTGINDIKTTHPQLASLITNEFDRERFTCSSDTSINFTCSCCKKQRDYLICSVTTLGYLPCDCRDNVSYPEKFISSLLRQLNKDNIWQYSKRYNKWIGDYKYDFYISEHNAIIETHGLQHYTNKFRFKEKRTKINNDERENDKYKRELALSNGIEHYIELDCRKSDMEWIKNSIMNSELPKLFNFKEEDIDWVKCDNFATKNINEKIYEEWNNLEFKDRTIEFLANKMNLSESFIKNALKKGRKLNLITSTAKVQKNNYLKVTDSDKNILGVYCSFSELSHYSKEHFCEFLTISMCQYILNKPNHDFQNIYIYPSIQEEYEKYKHLIPYFPIKRKYIEVKYKDLIFYFESPKEVSKFLNDTEIDKNIKHHTIGYILRGNIKLKKRCFDIKYTYLTLEEYQNNVSKQEEFVINI